LETNPTSARLTSFYGELSPDLETIRAALAAAGVDEDHVRARDLYDRDLDCHNLGMHAMLDVLANIVAEHHPAGPEDHVLDVGCGMGGPGRFLVDRFGCSIVGVDLLPERVAIAEALTSMCGMEGSISYRVADATELPFDDASFSYVWMLDVSMHIRDKSALFREIARVLRPDGLLVMHEQPGPLPETMRAAKRRAPYIAPPLPRLIRHIEDAELRLLSWHDTTAHVLGYFRGLLSLFPDASDPAAHAIASQTLAFAVLDGYVKTFADHGGRTGALVARRTASPATT
jgi:ubiquinone/menaquinone biosynthesis C-methylase UbiE